MAGGNDGFQERTEPASPKRLRDARRKGQVARSRELATTFLLLGSSVATLGLGPGIVADLGELMARAFKMLPGRVDAEHLLLSVLRDAITEALFIVAPLLALTALLAIAGSVALGGVNVAPGAMSFKLEKLDPIKGLGRVFSRRGLVELLKALAKFVLVAGTACALLWAGAEHVAGLTGRDTLSGLRDAGWMLAIAFLMLSCATVLISLVDVPFQIWQHRRDLRMTKQEVKDEMKQTEGKPEVKGRIRALQREATDRSMLDAVADADVLVTDTDGYAVALRYQAGETRVPRVVAKGRGFVALAIGRAAREHGVPSFHAPALTRSIHRHTPLDGEIPAGLYRAVAEVLAHLNRFGRGLAPDLDADRLPIPHDLKVVPDGPTANRM